MANAAASGGRGRREHEQIFDTLEDKITPDVLTGGLFRAPQGVPEKHSAYMNAYDRVVDNMSADLGDLLETLEDSDRDRAISLAKQLIDKQAAEMAGKGGNPREDMTLVVNHILKKKGVNRGGGGGEGGRRRRRRKSVKRRRRKSVKGGKRRRNRKTRRRR